eukprot:490672_1
MLQLLRHILFQNYRTLQQKKNVKFVVKFLKKRMKYLLSFLFIYNYQRSKLFVLFLAFYIIHQIKNHRKWWSGILDSSKLALFYFKTYHQIKFKKRIFAATDNEKYCIWIPPIVQPKSQHIWICLPGGMYDIDPAMVALYSNNTFKQSKLVCFNNPGISTKMVSKPLISPTHPQYLIEYIIKLKQQGYKVSLIGFSIGTVLAIRTLHTINNTDMYKQIILESVILVHAPDIVRDAVVSCANNWFFRMDIYFAFHIQLIHYESNSWDMIKDKVNHYWFQGWSFIQECTEICLQEKWQKCEENQFNLRTFCDESIKNVPVLRIIAKNDFIVPYEKIDSKYFKYFKEVVITERGGHCGVHASKKSMDVIKKWNQTIVEQL